MDALNKTQKSFTFKTFSVAINPNGPFRLSREAKDLFSTKSPNTNKWSNYFSESDRDNRFLIETINELGIERSAKKGHEIKLVELPICLKYFFYVLEGEGERILLNLNSNDHDHNMMEAFMDDFKKGFCPNDDEIVIAEDEE